MKQNTSRRITFAGFSVIAFVLGICFSQTAAFMMRNILQKDTYIPYEIDKRDLSRNHKNEQLFFRFHDVHVDSVLYSQIYVFNRHNHIASSEFLLHSLVAVNRGVNGMAYFYVRHFFEKLDDAMSCDYNSLYSFQTRQTINDILMDYTYRAAMHGDDHAKEKYYELYNAGRDYIDLKRDSILSEFHKSFSR